jgi:hypothetical protein
MIVMTKTDRIVKLLRAGHTPRDIAAKVGCSDAYVRTVKQRRIKGVNHDAAYKRKMHARVYADPEADLVLRQACRTIYRQLRQEGIDCVRAGSRASGRAHCVARKYLVNRNIQT